VLQNGDVSETSDAAKKVPGQKAKKAGGDVSAEWPPGSRPIAGMRDGWFYKAVTREILHRASREGWPRAMGLVPKVTGRVLHLTDDGETVRIEYQIVGKRQKRPRIVTEDELDRGTWTAKVGMSRPSSAEARQAFAQTIREESAHAPEVIARAYYSEEGDLVLPDADAQTFGYRVTRGTEEHAKQVWEELGMHAAIHPKTALVLGSMFVGPVLESIDVHAHILNLIGPGQQGKSTALVVCAALLGDVKPKTQKLMRTWNASKQGITQDLRNRGCLPMLLDEHSSSGESVKNSTRVHSQIVSGANRAIGSPDGSSRDSDGFWWSILLSSSNQPLKYSGQTEDLASRLFELPAPFFSHQWVNSDGVRMDPGAGGAEHLSKRLKRLAKETGGWPLEWAVRRGMFKAGNLKALKKAHLDLCAKYSQRLGGIPDTITEVYLAWVVGAYMLGELLDMPEIGAAAEKAAAELVGTAILTAEEAHIPDGERLWSALDGLRLDASSFPDIDKVHDAAVDQFRKVKGFTQFYGGQFEWWIQQDAVKQAATEAEIENLDAALRQLGELGVHIHGDGRNVQHRVPRKLRGFENFPKRMHRFIVSRADALFVGDDNEDQGDDSAARSDTVNGWSDTRSDSGPTPVGPPLTCNGPTGPTGPTPFEEDTHMRVRLELSDSVPMTLPETAPVVPAVSDEAFAALVARATGRTASATRFGVLGADDAEPTLHLPNCEPVPVELPGSVDDVPGLMDAYGLKTLWVHRSAAQAMGLPTFDERLALPVLGERRANEAGSIGPQTPVEHPWAVPSGGGAVVEMAPVGLASWLTLTTDQGSRQARLSVALPMYDTRAKRIDQAGPGGFGGAPTAAVLLDALMVYLVSTVHGPADRPKVVPFYMNVNKTGEDFAGGRERTDVLCETVRRRELDHVLGGGRVPLMVSQKWHRPLTEAERGAVALHRYDKTAAWLGAFSNVGLGIGEPEHAGEGVAYDRRYAGFWRVASVPGTGPEQLPKLLFREAAEGGYWVSTPSMELLLDNDLYPDWTPQVLEAWYWPVSKRALSGMYEKVRSSRNYIVRMGEQDRPGAKFAKQVIGRVYQSFRGYLGRVDGPKSDHANGGAYAKDIYYRPDWARLVMDHGTANLYRNLMQLYKATGAAPVAVKVDAACFTSGQTDPVLGAPQGMALGSAGGQWTVEASVQLADVLPALDAGKSATDAMRDYLKEG